ncbi:hypothetical protein L7F22_064885 [Adiantum nelumboides]|nr:hypothetical protein [Adiantum nelumboides]
MVIGLIGLSILAALASANAFFLASTRAIASSSNTFLADRVFLPFLSNGVEVSSSSLGSCSESSFASAPFCLLYSLSELLESYSLSVFVFSSSLELVFDDLVNLDEVAVVVVFTAFGTNLACWIKEDCDPAVGRSSIMPKAWRVPSTNEIPKILKGLHEEACGGHFSHELTLKKVLLAGYVWPSMHADVQHWCRSCHNCQVNGNKRLLYGPRQAVIANGPFEKWGIDAMGPLPRTANGKLYILVAIDYMTRWAEAQSVAKVNEKTVSKFVYTHICCRFGTPLEIVSDNGPGFRRGLLTEVCEELKISHRHSTPYYPQSNGLVEKANGIIAGIIRKMVESKPKRWDNFLDGAIWAYKTTYRDATQFTPFHLVYGQEALQPIELNIPTIKLTGRHEQSNDEAWIDRLLNLVELEWKREAAYHCYEKKALQLKDKLNEGIKDKEIKEKSLVLRYNNALDNRFDAKYERRWEGPFIVKKAFTGGYYQLMDLNGKEHPRKVNGYRLKPYLSRILPAVFETKQVSKKTKKVCCHCCSGTHQVKSCAFQHVLHEVAKDQKEKLSSPTSCPESSFRFDKLRDISNTSRC